MPRFDSDMDHRAYFCGEDPPPCVDCDRETTLTDKADGQPRCAACQEANEDTRTVRRMQAADNRQTARLMAWDQKNPGVR